MMQVAENEADQRRLDTFTTFPAPLFRADIQFQTFEATAVVPCFGARASEKCDCGVANWKISLAAKEIEPKSERLSLGNEN